MGVDRLLTTCEHISRVMEDSAEVFVEIGLEANAEPLRAGIRELDEARLSALAPPAEDSIPAGAYLARLSKGLQGPYEWLTPEGARWIEKELRHARGLVKRLLAPAEITGDADLVAEAQHWISHIDKGPPSEG